MTWHLHWLEAEGSLSTWKDEVSEQLCAAEEAVQSVVQAQAIDVLIAHRREGPVIPELGLCGFAYSHSMFLIACNPENPHFASSVSNGALKRQAVHEVHHCLRRTGPGYGSTLAEAIISEGLAGRFVEHVLGTPPELWEAAVDLKELPDYFPDEKILWSQKYDHPEWFFGTKELPRWLGYTMGYHIVGQWLHKRGPKDKAGWISTSAEQILAVTGILGNKRN